MDQLLQQQLDATQDEEEQGALEQLAMDAAMSFIDESEEEEEEEEEEQRKWGGSRPGKAPNKNRDFEKAHATVVKHYFSGTQSLYDETDFERRFSVPRSVFNRIWEELHGHDPFIQKYDALQKPGVSPLCRVVGAMRILSYGDCADRGDEYLQFSETVGNDTLNEP